MSIKPEPLFREGQWVTTEFCRGNIKQLAWGPDRNWGKVQWYYLLRITGSSIEHWVAESEILTCTGGTVGAP